MYHTLRTAVLTELIVYTIEKVMLNPFTKNDPKQKKQKMLKTFKKSKFK